MITLDLRAASGNRKEKQLQLPVVNPRVQNEK